MIERVAIGLSITSVNLINTRLNYSNKSTVINVTDPMMLYMNYYVS